MCEVSSLEDSVLKSVAQKSYCDKLGMRNVIYFYNICKLVVCEDMAKDAGEMVYISYIILVLTLANLTSKQCDDACCNINRINSIKIIECDRLILPKYDNKLVERVET